MREIKFRAWDKMGNCWIDDFAVTKSGEVYLHNNENYYKTDSVEPVVMQFTGLKDKNGKEIYEGDIVDRLFVFSSGSFIEHLGKTKPVVIVFNNGHFGYDNGFGNPLPIITERTKVIGNIYENPELIERSSTITN